MIAACLISLRWLLLCNETCDGDLRTRTAGLVIEERAGRAIPLERFGGTFRESLAAAASAGHMPAGVQRSCYLFGLLSLPYSLAHLDSQAIDRLINPAEALPLRDD
ncbi:hypothetical protein HDG34_000292 [Paraburkholderia sp. HC6.4b]|uniref:hypothetical protein n=1 Tax=unclassified Paraburkholderia TaxID=2615204 RepID=UPI00160B1002|nr:MULTISPECIES: hypothetical protein [unclassified Paraburkholderia]MBB5406377.1 hypothetical protein [Paraburkholderia sp. HC6.4b]MBB5448775.1 hypothetical protein [Paraburkholderia sp. Kb1A]